MFVVNEAEAAAIRAAYERGGEVSAGVELCRLFPGLTDKIQARLSARTIAGRALTWPERFRRCASIGGTATAARGRPIEAKAASASVKRVRSERP